MAGIVVGAVAVDEVVDSSGGDVGAELRQRRPGVAACESADRHDRLPGGQLVAGGLITALGGGHPGELPGTGRIFRSAPARAELLSLVVIDTCFLSMKG